MMSSETMDSSTQTYDDGAPDPDDTPRVQIDTSAPFRSVEEAVIRFGGRGFWIPRHLLHPDDSEEVDVYKLEEQAAEILKDLDTKEQETLHILKELELTKRLIEQLKLKLHEESAEFAAIPPPSPAGVVMMELKQAKSNLNQSTTDLEAIRASVEHVNKKIEKKKKSTPLKHKLDQATVNLQTANPIGVSKELRELNYEAEQFMKTAEAAKAEVLKAMSDIEQTKTGLKMIEMRWTAAKKLEEAAKATEALALAEIKAFSGNENSPEFLSQQKPDLISLSLEEYYSLAEKARKADNLFAAAGETQPPAKNPNHFRNFFPSQRRRDSRLLDPTETGNRNTENKPFMRSTTSIGDILSRKPVLRDDLDEERRDDRQSVSLNQMLRSQRPGTPPARGNGGCGESKGFFSKKKGLRFVHISMPLSKQSKNRIQAFNLW